MPVAAMVKGLEIEDLPAIVRYFKRQLPKLGVDIKTAREFNLFEVTKLKPEVVIVASGGSSGVAGCSGNRRTQRDQEYRPVQHAQVPLEDS